MGIRIAAFLVLAAALLAQSDAKKLTFDVVSIKRNNSGDNRRMIGTPPGGRITMTNVTLRQLIVFAYGDRSGGPAQDLEISGLPGWATTDGYDVQAQPEAGFTPTTQQSQEMLQSMLADRFKLKIRRETKDAPVYALVVGKDGVKMKLSEDQTPFNPAAGPNPPAAAGKAAPPPPGAAPGPMPTTGPVPRGMIMIGLGQIRSGATTMTGLAEQLTRPAGRKVIDKTGLTGLYDVDLKWTPDPMPNGAPLPPDIQIDPTGPTFFTAIQEQLGLRLAPEMGKVDTFVVESVERPSDN